GSLLKAAAFGEDLAGPKVFPGEVDPDQVELVLGHAGAGVGAEGAEEDFADLALEDCVGTVAGDAFIRRLGFELVDDGLGELELDAAPEAAVGEDRHGHRLHVVAVQRLPLIPAESADGAALPEGRVAGGIAAAGNETDHKAREHAFHACGAFPGSSGTQRPGPVMTSCGRGDWQTLRSGRTTNSQMKKKIIAHGTTGSRIFMTPLLVGCTRTVAMPRLLSRSQWMNSQRLASPSGIAVRNSVPSDNRPVISPASITIETTRLSST